MATRLVTVDRNTPLLLPPDLRDWVPAGDMVHFVIEAVEGMTLSTLTVNRRGSGSEQYPPKMMLGLLIYCYANGIFSPRPSMSEACLSTWIFQQLVRPERLTVHPSMAGREAPE